MEHDAFLEIRGATVWRGETRALKDFSLTLRHGESVAILGHISSFWNYRLNQNDYYDKLDSAEYADILMDFDDSLSSLSDV